MTSEMREAEAQKEVAVESSFLRIWKARDTDKSAQEVAEYLGCGCSISTTAL